MPNKVRVIADDLWFPEGPVWLPDGSIVLVEIRRGTLTRVGPDGKKTIVARLGGGPNESSPVSMSWSSACASPMSVQTIFSTVCDFSCGV